MTSLITPQSRHHIPPKLLQVAKNDETAMIYRRCDRRKKVMIHTIKQSALEYDSKYDQETFVFDITDNTVQSITDNVAYRLINWNGGTGYKCPVTSGGQAKHKVRTYWNREKPIPLGNYLFSYIVGVLFQYVMDGLEVELSNKERLKLFIHIFEAILNEKIQFDRSMSRPLILAACFFKTNKFKTFCEEFVKCFDYEWKNAVKVTQSVRDENGRSKSKYVRNPNRSKDLHSGFVDILMKIKNDLEQYDNISKELIYKINDFGTYIKKKITNIDNNNNEIPPNITPNIPPSINQREDNTATVMNEINNFTYNNNTNDICTSHHVYNNMPEQPMILSSALEQDNHIGTTMLSNGYDTNNYNVSQNGQTHFHFSSSATNVPDNITGTPTSNNSVSTPRDMPSMSLTTSVISSQSSASSMAHPYINNQHNKPMDPYINHHVNKQQYNMSPSMNNCHISLKRNNNNNIYINNNNPFVMTPHHSIPIYNIQTPTPIQQHYCKNVMSSVHNHVNQPYCCYNGNNYQYFQNGYCTYNGLHGSTQTVQNSRYNPITTNQYCTCNNCNNNYNHNRHQNQFQ